MPHNGLKKDFKRPHGQLIFESYHISCSESTTNKIKGDVKNVMEFKSRNGETCNKVH